MKYVESYFPHSLDRFSNWKEEKQTTTPEVQVADQLPQHQDTWGLNLYDIYLQIIKEEAFNIHTQRALIECTNLKCDRPDWSQRPEEP